MFKQFVIENTAASNVSCNFGMTPACLSFSATFAFVKTLASILSVYLLYLCCIPCIENNCATHNDKFASLEEPEHNGETELCTPFCIDNCCSPHVILQETINLIPSLIKHSSPLTVYVSRDTYTSVSSAVWQPPKITIALI